MQLTKPKVLAIAKESIDVGFMCAFLVSWWAHSVCFSRGSGGMHPQKISSSQVESGGHFQLKSMLLSKTIGRELYTFT